MRQPRALGATVQIPTFQVRGLAFSVRALGFVSGSSGLIGELEIPEQKIAWSRRNLSFTGSENWHVSISGTHVNARSVVNRNATPPPVGGMPQTERGAPER